MFIETFYILHNKLVKKTEKLCLKYQGIGKREYCKLVVVYLKASLCNNWFLFLVSRNATLGVSYIIYTFGCASKARIDHFTKGYNINGDRLEIHLWPIQKGKQKQIKVKSSSSILLFSVKVDTTKLFVSNSNLRQSLLDHLSKFC